MKNAYRLAAGIVLVTNLAGQAQASDFYSKVFGHEVRVYSDDDFNEVLEIDGSPALVDGQIFIEEIGIAGSYPYILGSAGPGGNLCAGTPFVVSFSNDKPAVDVSPLECQSLSQTINDNGILFESHGNAINHSRHLQWTPSSGFVEIEAPVEITTSGWDAFRSREISAPYDLFSYADLVEQLRDLVGQDWEALQSSVGGPPDGAYLQTKWIGTNCWAHACPYGGTFIAASMTDRRLYVALGDLDKPVTMHPMREEWPADLLQQVDQWAKNWQSQ